MTYWPQTFQASYHQLTVGLYTPSSLISTIGSMGTPTSFTLSGNRVECTPFRLARPATFRTAWWMNGATVNGTILMGIYDGTGVKLAESGDITQATINVIQSTSIGPITLSPGVYYVAMMPSSSTATFFIGANLVTEEGRHLGLHRQSEGSHVLPATLTISGSAGGSNANLFGLATQTVI